VIFLDKLYIDAKVIIENVIARNMPQVAVREALAGHRFGRRVYLVAIGKAAWTMAKAAAEFFCGGLAGGVVVTKYGHSQGAIPGLDIYEAGHPIADANTIAATEECIRLASGLVAGDELLFLVSGGGSALFEAPLPGVSLEDVQEISARLLASGADIVEVNTIRKRFSRVKAGRFAQLAAPARVFAIMLSDVLGDRLDSIASGPAVADESTSAEAMKIARKYALPLTAIQQEYLCQETPKHIYNVETAIIGSVKTLCTAAAEAAAKRGYSPTVLTSTLNCEAADAGKKIAAIAADIQASRTYSKPCAIILGGETVVKLTGRGKGGRNQELALAAAKGIAGMPGTVVFSLGSDGTDGPTDAAGGIVSGETMAKLQEAGICIDQALANNDSYNALAPVGGLIITGPTGTNVNDVAVLLCAE